MLKFLGILDKEQVEYVSWKNNHEIFDCLKGNGDLDILIGSASEMRFRILAQESGWLELKNSVAQFHSVSHFYRVSPIGKVFHLHVYFDVVTGESWLKEFILPLKEFLISERVMCPKYKIWVLGNKAQAYIFLIRHFLKTGSFTSRFLYWQEIDSYRSEWLLCGTSPEDLCGFGPIALDSYLADSGIGDEFRAPRLLDSIRFRLTMLKYCRFALFSLPILRLKSFSRRALNKILFKEKKKFLGRGMIIAISGADGAGKSSMIAGLNKSFSTFQSCYVYTLGKPQGSVVEFIRTLVTSKKRSINIEKNKAFKEMGLKKALASVVLGFLRLRKAKRARAIADEGNLVLVDRWPTNKFGKMDSPKILSDISSSWLLKMMAQLEKRTYEKIPRADLCFYLKVSIDTAVSRNETRVKIGKETKSEIVTRHIDNKDVVPLSNKIIEFQNEGPFNEKFFELHSIIWQEMIAFKSKENHFN